MWWYIRQSRLSEDFTRSFIWTLWVQCNNGATYRSQKVLNLWRELEWCLWGDTSSRLEPFLIHKYAAISLFVDSFDVRVSSITAIFIYSIYIYMYIYRQSVSDLSLHRRTDPGFTASGCPWWPPSQVIYRTKTAIWRRFKQFQTLVFKQKYTAISSRCREAVYNYVATREENIINSVNLGKLFRYANSKFSHKSSVGPLIDANGNKTEVLKSKPLFCHNISSQS